MFALVYSMVHEPDKMKILRRNTFIMVFFAILYYVSMYLAKHLSYDVNEDEFSIIKCFHFAMYTQAGIGYGYPFGNTITFYVNLLHVICVFFLTMGLV